MSSAARSAPVVYYPFLSLPHILEPVSGVFRTLSYQSTKGDLEIHRWPLYIVSFLWMTPLRSFLLFSFMF
ncbi:hypothetical protein BDQ94DRAFT_144436 [Aspergillus welwitschiae]|uniref:Uncharacterized protein n=1 Tax=Aspergillus welwitschiae TaxID=1341132 RepID=A0A3F3Q1V3_9EURO|nr:hypothetical protein BDQ94DRAFT_144436 [Aspergillus welwitschiae]RDH33065.1 hypothetical protein BDQ94DRAFT_144436 [Aspergillus welwitschiae]